MTPKGLFACVRPPGRWRSSPKAASSRLDDNVDREQVRRLVLSTGKVYYDIAGHDERAKRPELAVARIEQLYPFPVEPAARLVASYPALAEVVWAQEEPQNMGAWRAIRHRLEEAIGGRVPLLLRR